MFRTSSVTYVLTACAHESLPTRSYQQISEAGVIAFPSAEVWQSTAEGEKLTC
jgi:hypothetical protein